MLLMLCSDLQDNEQDGEILDNVLSKCIDELDLENKVCEYCMVLNYVWNEYVV